MCIFCLLQLITKAQQVVNEALDQYGASGVEKYAKERWYEYKRPTFTSSVSPVPVRRVKQIHKCSKTGNVRVDKQL